MNDNLHPHRPRRSDMALSLALPAAIIALGVALSLGSEPLGALLDYCLEALR
jgi:energy-converting hydrogenase Eha subunit A